MAISASNHPVQASRYTDQAQVARESHIPEEMSYLHAAVGTLTEEIDALCARLSKVTSPLDVEPDGENAPDAYRVPLAAEIRTDRRRLQSIIDQVRRLSASIEL